jgi:hypothetical protein
MTPKMILEILDANKGGADVACDEAFFAFREDVFGERAHVDVFVTRKALGLIVGIIHVPGQVRFEHRQRTYPTDLVLLAGTVMFGHIGTGTYMSAFTLDCIPWTFVKDMARHFQMGGKTSIAVFKRTSHGTFIAIHHQIINSERFLFGAFMKIAGHGADHAFLLDGSIIPVLMKLQIILET